MKIVESRPRRKSICGIIFDCEINPKDYGADCDAAGYLALDSELCDIKHLKAGYVLTDEQLCELVEESHLKRAKSRAMWYISQSSCSRKTLIDKLKKAFPEFAAVEAVDRMEELGFIDDFEYAKRRIQRIVEEKKVSIKMAKYLLEAEGVDRETAEIAAQELEYDAKAVIIELIEKKYRSKLQEKSDLDKTIAALMRKGYSYSEIKSALEEYNLQTEIQEDF
jgi:regulatory protein